MIISVASGKGGTGKTTVATSLALSLSPVTLLDCDVEEPNAQILIHPIFNERYPVTIAVPDITQEKCTACGKCHTVCAYHAIIILNNRVLFFPELCHGCGACTYFCPTGAICERAKEVGVVEQGGKDAIVFIQGTLNIGEPMAPPVIRAVKKYIDKEHTTIIDAAPGTSCAMITAIHGSDFCILVTEPTPFGLHDLTRAVQVVRELHIPHGVIINRDGLGTNAVEMYCHTEGIPILMRIPFEQDIATAYSRGIPITEAFPAYKKKFQALFERCTQQTKKK